MALAVESILVLDKKAVGVRFRDGNSFYDVETASLKGVTKEQLKGFKIDTLIPHGALLVTQQEKANNLVIKDMSMDVNFCQQAVEIIANKTVQAPAKEAAKTPAKAPAKEAKGKKKTKKFAVVVESMELNPNSGKLEPKQFSGEFEAMNALKVRSIAKEYYAEELGTSKDEIKVIQAELLN